MNIPIMFSTKSKYITAIAAFVLLSTLFALTPNSANALTLDLGKTLNTVTTNTPVVNMLIQAPAVTPTPAVTTQTNTPSNSVSTGRTVALLEPAVTPVTETVKTVTNTVAPVTAPIAAPVTTARTPATLTPAPSTPTSNTPAATRTTPTRTSIQTQTDALNLPSGIRSSAIVYPTNQITPKVASTIFFLGVAGILIGGCVIFATRPRMGISA